ncbi:hypothetical protein B0O80DRAFT_444552 [Mortierella sp. GBAus27b]|nr:hypothetical protein B0O80DRAFT_444552 [Mortierella sp. GBAus27b]
MSTTLITTTVSQPHLYTFRPQPSPMSDLRFSSSRPLSEAPHAYQRCHRTRTPSPASMLCRRIGTASQSVPPYLISTIWIFLQSLIWIITAEALTWVQSHGPVILPWDSFLLGSVFLIMDVDLDSVDKTSYSILTRSRQQHHGYESEYSHKKVKFDDQVLILGEAAQQGVTPIDTTRRSGYTRIDPVVPLAGYSTRSTQLTNTVPFQGQGEQLESPSSSSCRSSICSTSSDSSDKESKQHRSKLASFFQQKATRSSQSPEMTNQTSEKKSRRGNSLVRRIMHPHQHKRELEQQQQQQEYHVATPESANPWSVNSSDSEYQPDAHQRKTFIQRLGLGKRRSL